MWFMHDGWGWGWMAFGAAWMVFFWGAIVALVGWPMDARGMGRLRRRLGEQAKGKRVLEVGVGTGRNVPHYPPESSVVAVDLSPGMLRRAGERGGPGGGPGGVGRCH